MSCCRREVVEIARIAIIKGKKDLKFMEIVPAILLERLYDIILLLILSVALAAIFINNLILAALIIILGFLGILFIKPSIIEWLAGVFKVKTQRLEIIARHCSFVADKAIEMSKSIAFYNKNRSLLLTNLLLTLIAWIGFEAVSQYILLDALGVHISFLSLLGIVAVSWVLGTVSMLPGGLGAREVVYALALTGVAAGISFDTAFAIAMVYRAMVYVLFAILLSTQYLIIGFEKKSLHAS